MEDFGGDQAIETTEPLDSLVSSLHKVVFSSDVEAEAESLASVARGAPDQAAGDY